MRSRLTALGAAVAPLPPVNGAALRRLQLPPPPQDPIDAYLEELVRIVKKAMQGFRLEEIKSLPAPPRGFVGVAVPWASGAFR